MTNRTGPAGRAVEAACASSTPLRIGFSTIYAWRPHVEHMMFLARLAEEGGHKAVFLACDGDLPACYTRELRDVRPDWMECLLCRVGGVRSYTRSGISVIGGLGNSPAQPLEDRAADWAVSSASTLGRFEAADDYASAEFSRLRDRLAPAAALAYRAARVWIERERLDAVCVFNGRIDATRGIFEAARAAGIRVITFERSWFGDGLQLFPEENCLGLNAVHAFAQTWKDRPLMAAQARNAASRIASRITGTNVTEWRAYNTQATRKAWPVEGRRRILLLPGSLNEVYGVAQWQSGWSEPTAAYDALMRQLGLTSADLVLRCHPNWAEKIGKNDGRLAQAYYTEWARSRGIHVIASADRTSTVGLISECDAVALANSSAALEAAAMGKQVIATAPSGYEHAGFRTDATYPDRIGAVRLDVDLPAAEREANQDRLRRGALRFSYAMTHRLPQYVKHVKGVSSSSYRYMPGADPARLIDLVRTGHLEPDDAESAPDTSQENPVICSMQAGDWAALRLTPQEEPALPGRVRRRWLFQPIDLVREKMPVGDR